MQPPKPPARSRVSAPDAESIDGRLVSDVKADARPGRATEAFARLLLSMVEYDVATSVATERQHASTRPPPIG